MERVTSKVIRDGSVEAVQWAPPRIDADARRVFGLDAGDEVISKDGSPCTVRVIPTNEDLMIARHTGALLFRGREGEGK